MVMDEIIKHVSKEQMHPRDPVIICEATGMPYSAAEFRRKWRIVADYAGIPSDVTNMSSAGSKVLADEIARKRWSSISQLTD